MLAKIKRIVASRYMVLPILLLKHIVYYYLINVNLIHNIWVLGSVLLFGILYFTLADSKWKGHRILFLILYAFFSIIMFADSMYYNYYNQTVSIKQLWQAANVAKVPQSFIATLIPASFLLILDIPVIYYFFRKREQADTKLFGQIKKGMVSIVAILSVLILAVNPFDWTFLNRINRVEFFSNHIRDIYMAVTEPLQQEEVPEEEVLEAVSELSEIPRVQELANLTGELLSRYPELTQGSESKKEVVKKYGIARGRNLILIQIEALQSMMLQAEYNGQELTPNLNHLIQEDSLYFDRYYSTIGKGNTADAEFTTLNSLYPVIDRECYELYQTNTYDGLPWMLREKGYETFAVHGYYGDFWNRNYAYPYQGIEEYYSMEDLDASEQIGLGISDRSMFHQAVEKMQEQDKPFFAFLITLTNHHPYVLEEELCEISLLPEHEETKFGQYLQTVHYTDQAIGNLIQELMETGLYESSVIAMYGDHHGLNKGMDDNDIYISEWLGREYDYDEMFRVPLLIHIPGMGEARTISTLGGQVDFLPTMANLMGLELDHPYILGRDLCNSEEGFIAFTAYLFEGSFAKDDIMFEISREGLFEGSRAWKIGDGTEVDIESLYEDYERAVKLKETSKEILEQDLIGNHVQHEVVPYIPPEDETDQPE